MSLRKACALFVFACAGGAQLRAQASPFRPGHISLGPVIGSGAINGAKISLGFRLEAGVRTLPDLLDGVLGVQGLVDRYSYRRTVGGVEYTLRHTLFGAVANYHLALEDSPWDPFFGAGFGHEDERATAPSGGPPYSGSASAGLFLIVHAGLRYYVSPRFACYVDAGAGMSSLNAGVMFGLK